MSSSKERLLKINFDLKHSFPTLSSQVVYDPEYLHVWKYSQSGLKYLPNFHLIFEVQTNEKMSACLLSFHGKILDTLVFDDSHGFSDEIKGFIEDYEHKNDFICQGIKKKDFDNFVECFDEEIILRSAKCTILLPGEQESMCFECEKILITTDFKDEEPPPADSLVDTVIKEEEQEYLSDDEVPIVKRKRGRPRKTEVVIPPKKKKRGRPPNLDKVSKAKATNRAPRSRTEEDLLTIQSDQTSGYRGTCAICLRSFTSQVFQNEDMESHKKHFSVEGKISCPLCKIEADKLTLTCHFQEVHSPQTCCIVCSEVFSDKEGLKNHIFKSHHVKPSCPICGKTYSKAYRLEVHINSSHKKIRDVFCHQCGKGFAHKVQLKTHLRTTCGTQDFKCPLCTKTFETLPKVQSHLKIHCTERPYVCPLCTYRSYKMNNMFLHSRKVHRLKGCKDDFFVDDSSLKKQKEFLEEYLKVTFPLNKDTNKM